ncbi:DUF4376 domain-containing protein [Photobacterium sp. 1_MG-2023]|uniref:DUF4376 domain-containing protein n=1 Tax=Photobacterium sp. 1_MG-2023 TaxID=3062646 RepID=UPI0026E2B7F3|nr:DUF4376 domain-containing protein [Photobacterium sp. 1_MG-2023]MDO6708393.1 DUF4376 domain-containing protein [Photobacterium sp. 1_MG-2023]
MFEKITDVPAALAPFYETETRHEPLIENGEQVYSEEPHEWQDGEGNTQTGTQQVPVFIDVVYVIQKTPGERKSWADVERVALLGKPQPVIETFIECAHENDRWMFHDEYLAWLSICQEITAQNDAREPDEDTGELPPAQALPPEPVFSVQDAQPYLVTAAKQARDDGRYAPIIVDGHMFDADLQSYENITGTVTDWDILVADQMLIESGLIVDGQMKWTLANNSEILVTKADLAKVVRAIKTRAALLHREYQLVKQ